jgi:hypothetical protein
VIKLRTNNIQIISGVKLERRASRESVPQLKLSLSSASLPPLCLHSVCTLSPICLHSVWIYCLKVCLSIAHKLSEGTDYFLSSLTANSSFSGGCVALPSCLISACACI